MGILLTHPIVSHHYNVSHGNIMALRKPNVSNTVNARSSYKNNLFSSGRIILAVLNLTPTPRKSHSKGVRIYVVVEMFTTRSVWVICVIVYLTSDSWAVKSHCLWMAFVIRQQGVSRHVGGLQQSWSRYSYQLFADRQRKTYGHLKFAARLKRSVLLARPIHWPLFTKRGQCIGQLTGYI